MQIIRERILQARNERGISQKKMAEMLGISQPGYSQIESGKYPDMRISTLVKICQILNVSVDWLLGFIDCDPETKFNSFYMEIIDTIVEYENDEVISENASYKLTTQIERIKCRYDDIC